MAPSEVIAMRRGRAAARVSGYSVSWKVSGSTVAILLVPNSTSHGRPDGSRAIPYGRARGVGTAKSRTWPVPTVSFPTALPPCTVNQISPWRSQIMVWGSRARVRHRVPADGAVLRIEPADVRGRVARVPDDAGAVQDEVVRPGPRSEIELLELARAGIEHTDVVALLPHEPHPSLAVGIRIARARAGPRDGPLPHRGGLGGLVGLLRGHGRRGSEGGKGSERGDEQTQSGHVRSLLCGCRRGPRRSRQASVRSAGVASLGSGDRFSRAGQISPRRASAAMCSPARYASAWIVQVGWPRPPVTRLEPSQMKRFRTSCVRWYLSTTDVRGSLPIRQVPSRWAARVASCTGCLHVCRAPAASRISTALSCRKRIIARSSAWSR